MYLFSNTYIFILVEDCLNRMKGQRQGSKDVLYHYGNDGFRNESTMIRETLYRYTSQLITRFLEAGRKEKNGKKESLKCSRNGT